MNARIRTIVYTTLAPIAMLSVGCGDDGENPALPAAEEQVLATVSGGGSSNGPIEPEQPYAIIVEFGVADEENYERPDVVLFANRDMEDGVSPIATQFDTANLDIIADRLTDGADGTAYLSGITHVGSGSQLGPESAFFTYDPGITRIGPDLKGFEVTGIQVEVELQVTQNGPNWLMEYEYTVSILGH